MFEVKTFPCPECQQFINDTMTSCKFCSAPLDAQAITTAAENQEKVIGAYNAASNLRILGGVLATSFFLGFIPFLGIIANIGHLLIFIALPFLLIFWQIKHGRVKSTDKDLTQAKKYWLTALGIWLIFFVVQILWAFLSLGVK